MHAPVLLWPICMWIFAITGHPPASARCLKIGGTDVIAWRAACGYTETGSIMALCTLPQDIRGRKIDKSSLHVHIISNQLRHLSVAPGGTSGEEETSNRTTDVVRVGPKLHEHVTVGV